MEKAITVHASAYTENNPVHFSITTRITDGIGIFLTGLSSQATRECLLRTVQAIGSSGFKVPGKKIIISIEPDLDKIPTSGSSFLDLPLAVSILAASGQTAVTAEQLADCSILGELRLDGSVRAVPDGCLAIPEKGMCIIPSDNAEKAANRYGADGNQRVFTAGHLNDALMILEKKETGAPAAQDNAVRRRYTVNVHYDAVLTVSDIIADSEEEALEKASATASEMSLNEAEVVGEKTCVTFSEEV